MAEITALALYRSIHKTTPGYDDGTVVDGKAVVGVLYPDLEPRRISKTRMRPADLPMFTGERGIPMVRNNGGTSLFDKPNVLPGGATVWHSFKIPQGAVIPDSLVVRFTGHNSAFGADHYQIEIRAQTMSVVALKGALDNLARNAVVRLVELGEAAVTFTN
jgi:hypothetical protein